jgi:hypothetical protein
LNVLCRQTLPSGRRIVRVIAWPACTSRPVATKCGMSPGLNAVFSEKDPVSATRPSAPHVANTGGAVAVSARLMCVTKYGGWFAHHDSAFQVLHCPANGSTSLWFASYTSKCRCGPVELPELPTLPRYSPTATRSPMPFGVGDPLFIWPYHAIEPSSCWM